MPKRKLLLEADLSQAIYKRVLSFLLSGGGLFNYNEKELQKLCAKAQLYNALRTPPNET